MLVVLEGVDGSGKSSLATEIAKQLRKKYPLDDVVERHSGPLHRDPVDEYIFSLDFYRPGVGTHVILDRWHWGELVYGPIYRGGSAIDTPTFRWMDTYLSAKGAATFLVTNTLEEISRRLLARGEDFLRPEHVKMVIDGFLSVERGSPSSGGIVKVGNDESIDAIARRIIVEAECREERAYRLYQASNSFVGRLWCDYLLVGDKRGGQAPYVTDAAFFPVNGNSATFLWNALSVENLWTNVGLINANEENSIQFIVDTLNEDRHGSSFPVKILALGAEAHKVLSWSGVPHGRVPHPQFVRRFHNTKLHDYGQLIAAVLNSQEDKSKWPK